MDSEMQPLQKEFEKCGGENVVDWRVKLYAVGTEARKQYELAGPIIVSNLLQYSISVTANMFVGHLGELQLSSVSLAASLASVTGYQALFGLSCGLETLYGQAYGARNYHLLSVYLQSAVLVLVTLCVPLASLWLNMETILVALGQDPKISRMAGVYFAWLSPSLVALAIMHPILKFLQAQSVVVPMMLCSLVTVIFHIPSCYLLVNTLGLGLRGGAMAVSVANYVNLLLLIAYIYFSSEFKKTWTGLSREAFGAITAFLKLGIPSAAMICLEYWAFEGLILFAGVLPNPQLQVSLLSIWFTAGALGYMVPLGLSGAVSTRVSNELGAGRPSTAKFAVKVIICIALISASVIATTDYLIRNSWGRAFSDEDEVVHAVAKVMPLVACVTFLDAVQAALAGVVRGCGWQEKGTWVNLGSYYVIGIPAALLLGYYYNYGALGLYLGFYCGTIAQMILLLLLTTLTNWETTATDAQQRVCAPAEETSSIILDLL